MPVTQRKEEILQLANQIMDRFKEKQLSPREMSIVARTLDVMILFEQKEN